jgi:hypothetical protein
MTGKQRDRQQPAVYEIRVRGHLGPTMLRAFTALRAETRDGDTLLRGPVTDQAALHGLLAQIEALSLELLEVRRLAREQKPGTNPPAPDAGSPGQAAGLTPLRRGRPWR